MNRKMLLSAFLLVAVSSRGATPLLEVSSVAIPPGERHVETIPSGDGGGILLWVRGRIQAEDEAAGAYALKMEWNGTSLTPDNVRVLNKGRVYDRPDEALDTPCKAAPLDLFHPESSAWYLKADNDGVPFNAADSESPYFSPDALTGGSWWHVRYKAFGAFESHFYEYLVAVPADRVDRENRLAISNLAPEGREITVESLLAVSGNEKAILASRDWEDIVFPWQAPAVKSLLVGDRSVRVAAARGETRPAELEVFALEDLDGVTLVLNGLEGPGGRIGPERIDRYRVESLARNSMGEAGFIAQLPFVPEEEKKDSPELLRSLEDGPVAVAAHRLQRFLIDIRIPGDAVPGLYRGTVSVMDASGEIGTVPLEVEVYPFDLAEPRQTYWIWRLTWSPIWEPANVANLKEIAANGFAGQARETGPSFKFSAKDGTVAVDGTDYRRMVATLREAGLDPTLRHTGLGGALNAALEAAGVQELVRARMEALEKRLRALAPETPGEKAEANDGAAVAAELLGDAGNEAPTEFEALTALLEQLAPVRKGIRGAEAFILHLAAHVDETLRRELLENPKTRSLKSLPPPALVGEALPEGVTVAGLLEETERLVEEALREAKAIAEEENATLYVFPVDEPDGTPWRRGWTMWLSARAHAVGLQTWSTLNGPDNWDSGIDIAAPGATLSRMYTAYGGYRPWMANQIPEERRAWYRENVRANYMQVRSMPPNNYRPKMGLMAWAYYNLEEITAFCYDWNFNHLYSVYPEDGDRRADRWFPTLGWRGTREGITDARYLRTLELLYQKRGMDEASARAAVIADLGPIDDPASYGNIKRVPEVHGSFDALRRRIAERIVELLEKNMGQL